MIPICILTPQGVTPAPYEAETLADAAMKEPEGVYTAARTFQHNKALLFDNHLDRLERSAELEGIHVQLDRPALRFALRTLIEQSGYAESRFRITIPRNNPDHQIISLELYHPVPADVLANGARVVTVNMARHNPIAKTTRWIKQRKSTVESFPPGIYEGILVSSTGALLECTTSNFYAIKNGTLFAAADNEVLGGIARQLVLKVAESILPIQRESVNVDDLNAISEAFLSSAGRGIVPIVEIDGKPVGNEYG